MPTIAISPLRCRVWSLHSRLDETLTEESCRTEIESFEKHGQQIPVLGRRLRGDRDYDIELIYGARRLFVARHLNVPLLVELRDISDRDGIIEMEFENRMRKDISAYERAVSYERWLRDGHFRSQEELASALQVSRAQVSRLLKLARLPRAVLEAFDTPTSICEVWGAELASLVMDREGERRVVQAARSIAAVAPRPGAEEIYRQLCAAAKSARTLRTERVVEDAAGDELFRVKQQRNSVIFSMPLAILSQDLLEDIELAIVRVLDEGAPTRTLATRRDELAEEAAPAP